MDKKPLVSILVPTYNGGKRIRRFLESVLSQKLENYEVIFVDDMSDDDTLEVLEEYRREFPDKLFVFPASEHNGSIGHMRNLAYSHSRGDYVFWCDQDDILHPCGLSTLYEEAVNNDSEITSGWAKLVTVDDNNLPRVMSDLDFKKSQNVSNETEIMCDVNYWVRLFKRTLVERVGPIPENCFFDDVAYLPILQSHAKKIRHVNQIVYYYHRKVGSASNTISAEVAQGSIKAEKYALEHCNPKYLKEVQCFIAKRTVDNLNRRWPFYDLFADWAKEQMSWLADNELVKKNKCIFDTLRSAERRASIIAIPNRVYTNGFEGPLSKERITELTDKVFHDGCECVVLSEDNCDIDSNEYIKDAFGNGMTEFIAEYFALKSIYENGGFYIHDRIKILNYFSYVKNQNAVFFRLDNSTYSKYVFGAPPENEVIEAILTTYSYMWDKRKEFIPLDKRIKIILTAKYGIPINGSAKWFSSPLSIIPANYGVVNVEWGRPICEHDFSAFADDDEYITVKKSTLMDLVPTIARDYANSLQINKQPADKNAALLREYENMKHTNTYKLMMKIRSVGDGPMGPFLKKIFHGILKIRSKFKRK